MDSMKVLYTCEGANGVGFQGSSGWQRTMFSDKLQFRILEGFKGKWFVYVKFKNWEMIGDEKPFESWFLPRGTNVGQNFSMNLETGRFSYSDSFGYLTDDNKLTAHMYMGSCRRQY